MSHHSGKIFLLLICFIFNSVFSKAQSAVTSPPAVTLKGYLQNHVSAGAISYFIDTSNGMGFSLVRQFAFNESYSDFSNRINKPLAREHFWLKFQITNLTDSSLQTYLYFGQLNFADLYFVLKNNKVQVFQGGDLRSIRSDFTYLQKTTAAIPFQLRPKEDGELYLELNQRTEEFSFDDIYLYDEGALYQSQGEDFKELRTSFIIQVLFQGFLICQLLYSFFQWMIIRRREYLYYFLYIFFVTLYFLNKFEKLYYVPVIFSGLPMTTVYFSKTMLILPYFFYFRFVRTFLDMPRNYPVMNKWIKRIERFLIAYGLFDLVFIVFTFNVRIQREIYSYIFLLIFLTATAFIIYLFRKKKKLNNYILLGSLFAGLGNITAMILTYLNDERIIKYVPDILIFSQAGIILEIFCFTAGLSYKTMSAEKEKIKSQENLIEQLKTNELLQTKMQTIRNTIARDLHDDIGSTLSSISILSNLALKEKNPEQTTATMYEIKDSSVTLMEKMDDIVWSINPRNDSLENLLLRIKRFATTLFEAKNIDYTITIQDDIKDLTFPADWRQHIYLILKEAINNLVKYSEATRASIQISYRDDYMELRLQDNGKGFDVSKSFPGNGLISMRNRADLIGGELTLTSLYQEGTLVSLRLKIK